jgi:hypothetical protein
MADKRGEAAGAIAEAGLRAMATHNQGRLLDLAAMGWSRFCNFDSAGPTTSIS